MLRNIKCNAGHLFNSNGIEPTFLKLNSWSPGAGFIPIITSNVLNQIKKKRIQINKSVLCIQKKFYSVFKNGFNPVLGSIPCLPQDIYRNVEEIQQVLKSTTNAMAIASLLFESEMHKCKTVYHRSIQIFPYVVQSAKILLLPSKCEIFFVTIQKWLFYQYCDSNVELFCSPFSYRSSNFAIAKVVALNLFVSFFYDFCKLVRGLFSVLLPIQLLLFQLLRQQQLSPF